MKKGFLYQQIASDIRSKIEDGTYVSGSLLDSPQALSVRFSASTITVNKALLALAEEGYIKRIPGKGSVVEESGVQQQHQSGLIGAIVYDLAQSDIWASALRAVEAYLFDKGFQLLVGNDLGLVDRTLQYIDRFIEQRVKGLIIVPVAAETKEEYTSRNEEIVRHLRTADLPFVILHRVLGRTQAFQVGYDNLEDAAILTQALLNRGTQHPLLLSHDLYNSVTADRERGYTEVLHRVGMTAPIVRIPLQLSYGEGEPSDFSEFLIALIADHPQVDTLIAVDDQILILLNTALQSDLLSGSNLFYSGFGLVDEAMDRGAIGLYQHQDPANLGKLAARALLDLVKGEESLIPHIIRVPSTLVGDGA